MIKIVFEHKNIFLTSSYKDVMKTLPDRSCMIVFNPEAELIIDIFDRFQISEFSYLIVQGNEEENLMKFKQRITTIKAGGGIVKNKNNEYLFIYRRKKWDLPKGKCDEGEEISACALREVKEETGLQDLILLEKFMITYHCYIEDQLYLKETYWYLMSTGDQYLHPQKEEGITKAIWVHPNNIQFQLEKTYESIKDIFKELGHVQGVKGMVV